MTMIIIIIIIISRACYGQLNAQTYRSHAYYTLAKARGLSSRTDAQNHE